MTLISLDILATVRTYLSAKHHGYEKKTDLVRAGDISLNWSAAARGRHIYKITHLGGVKPRTESRDIRGASQRSMLDESW